MSISASRVPAVWIVTLVAGGNFAGAPATSSLWNAAGMTVSRDIATPTDDGAPCSQDCSQRQVTGDFGIGAFVTMHRRSALAEGVAVVGHVSIPLVGEFNSEGRGL